VFIGLTSEDASALSDVKKFLRETGITWPNGYGAEKTIQGFKVSFIPAKWVIGRDGKVVWNQGSEGEFSDGIEKALAAPEPSSGSKTTKTNE